MRRLPDESFYHEERIQKAILDVLFIYCKANPGSGGYRQGMHELLAPMLYVVDQDCLDPSASADPTTNPDMLAMLDPRFVEHDAFALFTKVMAKAREFYEVTDLPAGLTAMSLTPEPTQSSKIVEKSRHIHEILLFKVDPELSTHLKTIEILPQIFLMSV